MMGRSSKRQAPKGIASSKDTTVSGAYIRSLVKQLTTSTARTTKDQMAAMGSRDQESRDCTSDETQHQQQPMSNSNSGPAPAPHKKQVRRRLHTTRPYQERLLNMAEARREIVAALKFHRAAMKQAQEQQQHQEKHHKQSPSPLPNPLHHPPNYLNYQFDANSTPLSPFPYPPPAHNLSPSLNQNPFSWPIYPISPLMQLPSSAGSFPIALPTQALGLNLNFQDFDNLYHNGSTTPPSIYSTSPSPPSSSSSSSSSAVSTISHEVGQGPRPAKVTAEVANEGGSRDHEEMAEAMRSIGERHQMEWNDRMNLVTSAWWFEFLKGMEAEDEEVVKRAAEECYGGGDGFQIFDEVMEFPPWLGGGESCLQQHLVDDCFSDDYFQQDASLACMDIGEIEGIDGEWLS